MFFLWRHQSGASPFSRGPNFGIPFIIHGLLFILFGLAILSAPELLAYIVATFLIFVGFSLLLAGWKMRR